jgi:DNA-binding transcriptional LysR family regulator
VFVVHDLAALVAVAESGSVRRAASTLGRTQPAVSQAIQRLEEAAGFALLDRSGYRVRLTERGETFVKRARAMLKQARDLHTFASVLSSGVEARLRIGVHGALPATAWMPLVGDVAAHFPETVLEIQAGEGDAPIRRLIEDEADLAVALGSVPDRHAAGIECRELGALEFVNVAHSRRLASQPDGDLDPLPQILVADFDDPVASYGVSEGHRYWRVSDHRMKAALIAAGAGWGSVPVPLVESALQDGTLSPVSRRGAAPRTSRTYSLYRRLDEPQGPVAAFIWDRCDGRGAG